MRILSHLQASSGGKVNYLALANVYSRGVGANENKKIQHKGKKLAVVEFHNRNIRRTSAASQTSTQEGAVPGIYHKSSGILLPNVAEIDLRFFYSENIPNNPGPSDCKGRGLSPYRFSAKNMH